MLLPLTRPALPEKLPVLLLLLPVLPLLLPLLLLVLRVLLLSKRSTSAGSIPAAAREGHTTGEVSSGDTTEGTQPCH